MIEIFQNRYDSFNVNRKIKEITGTFKKRHKKNLSVMMDGMVIIERLGIKDKWKKYQENLFYDQRPRGYCLLIITDRKY